VISFRQSELRDLGYGVLVANTPNSLFAWLRTHPAVLRVAEAAADESELIDALLQAVHKQPRTEITAATAYAYLVALILRRFRNGPLGSFPLSAEMLRWAQPIWDRASLQEAPTTRSVHLQITTPASQSNATPTPAAQSHSIPNPGTGHTLLVNQFGGPISRRTT
jgi:hypothetical protein